MDANAVLDLSMDGDTAHDSEPMSIHRSSSRTQKADVAGFDIGGAAAVDCADWPSDDCCVPCRFARVLLQNGWDAAYVEAGGPGSPNWWKSNALKTMRAQPELHGKLLAQGSWDYALIELLAPQAGDLVVRSHAIRRSSTLRSTRCCVPTVFAI